MAQMKFDGFEVNLFEGKITGKFEMDDLEASKLGLDRVVIVVAAARLGKASVETTGDGDIKRVNTFTVSEVKLLEGEVRDQAIRYLAMPMQEGLDFGLEPEDDEDLELVDVADGRS